MKTYNTFKFSSRGLMLCWLRIVLVIFLPPFPKTVLFIELCNVAAAPMKKPVLATKIVADKKKALPKRKALEKRNGAPDVEKKSTSEQRGSRALVD